jgi:hypothetical protein
MTTARFNNAEGGPNTAVRGSALFSHITRISNAAMGYHAMYTTNGHPSFADGSYNGAGRAFALSDNSTGHYNSAFATSALGSNTTGENNTATGCLAPSSNIGGHVRRLPEGPPCMTRLQS